MLDYARLIGPTAPLAAVESSVAVGPLEIVTGGENDVVPVSAVAFTPIQTARVSSALRPAKSAVSQSELSQVFHAVSWERVTE